MYIPQIDQQVINRLADGSPSKVAPKFPPNLAASLTPDLQKKILMWLSSNYIWPQIQERVPFEGMWNKMLEMARISMPGDELFNNTDLDASRAKQAYDQGNKTKARVSDSVVHDAIERLTDITYFVAFKEGLPAQFTVPEFVQQPMATPEYRPLDNRIKAGNAILQWNSGNHNVKRNSFIAYRHHFTYGCSFVRSDYKFRMEMIGRQDNMGNIVPVPEITEIGTTFEPMSIRKLWFNWRLPVYDMDVQPCPFYFEEVSRFAVLQNEYHPTANPFGYLNLDKLSTRNYIYSEAETQSVRDAFRISMEAMQHNGAPMSTAAILDPKFSVEALWTLYPMMPFDPATGEFEFRADGKTPIPANRFIVETFGPNVHSGGQVLLRLQQNYYPKRKLPIYASCHMPDLDSGAYAPSLGQLLYNHFREITLCMEQYFQNKDLINDPPAWVQISSPALNADLNQKGSKIKVNGPNDFGWRTPYDATASTVMMIKMLKEDAQTTSKVVDAIMGKAMGSRTSASEANNAFQASMSAITTDIDMITSDLHGSYAERLWNYTGLWFDPDLLMAITGQFGFQIAPQDMWLNLGIKTNVGSTFVEKMAKQQNYRYILEASRGEPGVNRPELWRLLLKEMGFDSNGLIADGGRDNQIQQATMQACQTYLGYPVMIDPDQDHQLSMQVKTAFIKDRLSVWNTTAEYAQNAPALVDQIKQHQFFIQLQMQMQLVQQQMAVAQAQLGVHQDNPQNAESEGAPGRRNAAPPPQTTGQMSQQGAGAA